MGYNPQARTQVLEYLEQRGGFVIDASGRATDKLRIASGYGGSMPALSALLATLEHEGLIHRDVMGKRCYRIGLTKPVIVERVVEVEHDVEVPVEVAAQVDYDHLACEVVATLIEQLAPRVTDPEMQRRLARVHEHARSLESRLTTAQQELEAARDAYAAARREAAGLRERLQQAEDNIEHLKREHRDGGLTAAEEALERLMSERPRISAGGS